MASSPEADAVEAVERLARVRAAIERRGERDAALAEVGLDIREWFALQRTALALFERADGSALALGHRYRVAYAAAAGGPAGPRPAQPAIPSYLRPDGTPPAARAPAVRIEVQQSPPPDVTAEQINPLAKAVTPFRALDSEALGYTLQRFAELSAAIRRGSAESAHASFGLDASSAARIEAYWSARLAANAVMRTEFERLVRAALEIPTNASSDRGEGTGTVEVDQRSLLALVKGRAPAAAGQPLPSLTVDQYAWVTATLRRAGSEGRAEALVRLRLTEQQHQQLEKAWRDRMSGDPALTQAFIVALARLGAGEPTG